MTVQLAISMHGLLSIALAVSVSLASGQPSPAPSNPRYVFQPLAERLDISTTTVTAVAQDSQGFLWMGTQQGLLRYDGSRIARFGREQGLPTLFIDQIVAARDGSVWVATNDGIARFVKPESSPGASTG